MKYFSKDSQQIFEIKNNNYLKLHLFSSIYGKATPVQ